jgi:hydroxymethylbilane synthase
VTRLRIATRSSALALWQANHVAALLSARTAVDTELVHISTQGDRERTEPLESFGGVGVFTREVQKALLDGRADLAVHSLKDLPTELAPGLTLAAVPERAPRFDALILPAGVQLPPDMALALAALPDQARIGTGSPRRRSQLLRVRPDLVFDSARGNVDTRLRKLDEGLFDALILAEAGLVRLGLADRISVRLEPPLFLPAVGQGALGIECRSDDAVTLEHAAAIDHAATRAEITAERAALATLRAGCHAPVGALAALWGDRMSLDLVVLSADGRERFATSSYGSVGDATTIGQSAANALLATGAARLLS